MSLRGRVIWVAVVAFAVTFSTVAYLLYLTDDPPPVEAAAVRSTAAGSGTAQELTLQTVGSLGPDFDHPEWVSYLAKTPEGKWIRSTDLIVPAHSTIHVTIDQYDSPTGLRNPYFSRVQGTRGNSMTVNGRRLEALDPDLAAHTFAVPELGIYVPLKGVPENAPKQCAAAPCTEAEAHETVQFSFDSGEPGKYRWQCFVPCAAGFIDGFGGPMQTFGYMDGYLRVE